MFELDRGRFTQVWAARFWRVTRLIMFELDRGLDRLFSRRDVWLRWLGIACVALMGLIWLNDRPLTQVAGSPWAFLSFQAAGDEAAGQRIRDAWAHWGVSRARVSLVVDAVLFVPVYTAFLALLLTGQRRGAGDRAGFRLGTFAASLALLAGVLDLIEDGATLKLLAGPSSSGVWLAVLWLVRLKWALLAFVLLVAVWSLVLSLYHSIVYARARRSRPAESPPDPSLETIVMVHGTYAADQDDSGPQWWQDGSAVRASFEETFRGRAACDIAFHWTGKNKESERLEAARRLLARLEFLRGSAGVHLIGHSHGGLAIWRALCLGKRRGVDLSKVKSWATVGTPFLHFAFDLAALNVVLASVAVSVGAVFGIWAVLTLLPYGIALAISGSYLFEALALATCAAVALACASVRGLVQTLYAAWSSWWDSRAQADAWKEHGGKWLGLWSDDDEAIRGLRQSKKLEGDWRAYLPLPAGADTLANELVWSTLRRFVQGSDLLARELVDVTTGPMGDVANRLTSEASAGLLAIAEAQGRDMSNVLRRAFADATANNVSEALHILIELLGEAELTKLLVHCAYFPSGETMDVLGPREVIRAIHDRIRDSNTDSSAPPVKRPRGFVGPVAWRPSLAAISAAGALMLVTSAAFRFVAEPYTTDAVVREVLGSSPLANPDELASSPDVIEHWIQARIAKGADPSTMGPMLRDRAFLPTIADALTSDKEVDTRRLARFADTFGLDRVALHYFVGRALAMRERLGEAVSLADALPTSDAAELLLGVAGELDGRTGAKDLDSLRRRAERILLSEADATAGRYLDNRAKARAVLAILASVRGSPDVDTLKNESDLAISAYHASLMPPSLHGSDEVEKRARELGWPDGHTYRAWGRHHLLAGRYREAWDMFWRAGELYGRCTECENVVVEASRHGGQTWAMTQVEQLRPYWRTSAMTRVALHFDKAGRRNEGVTLASGAAKLWAGLPNAPATIQAYFVDPVIPWTNFRDLLVVLGKSAALEETEEIDGLDALQAILDRFTPEERVKAVASAAEEIVSVESPKRIAAFLERLDQWRDPSIAAFYGVVARRERAGAGEPIVDDIFGVREKRGGGIAAMDAPGWIHAQLLLTSGLSERPGVPPIDALRPWASLKTVAEVGEFLKDTSYVGEPLKALFLLEFRLLQLIDKAKADKQTAAGYSLNALANEIDAASRGRLRQDVNALLCEAYIALHLDRLAYDAFVKCRPTDQVRLEPALLKWAPPNGRLLR
jgi:hypothetical protein